MKQWIERIKRHPVVAHALCAVERFNERLGPQFAGSITYFSVLSVVPILMFVFASIGMTLTVFRPELLTELTELIHETLGAGPLGEAEPGEDSFATQLADVITRALLNWRGLGVVAIVTAGYAGTRWAGNLKAAVRVMWSSEFEDAARKKNFVAELGGNLLIFLGLVTTLFLGMGIASVGGTFSEQIIQWLGWDAIPGISFLVQFSALLMTFLAGWVMFAFLFMVLPNEPAAPRPWLIGTLVGALGVTVLQSVAGRVLGLLSSNASAAAFGSTIVIMLLFNMLAMFILFTAAWVGTEGSWREELAAADGDPAERATAASLAPGEAVDGELPSAPPIQDAYPDDPYPWGELPQLSKEETVRQDVAARGMRVNLGIGYGLGAATGMGVGALLIGAVRRIRLWMSKKNAA